MAHMAKSDGKPQLTDSAIKKIIDDYAEHGTKSELIDIRIPGLRILPLRHNRAKWSLMVRDQSGKLKRFSLGEYPALGIKKAREAAEIMRHQVRHKGEDPNAERQAKREAAKNPPPPELTLQEIIDLYAAAVGPVRKSWWTVSPLTPGRPAPAKQPEQAKRGDGKRRIESVFAPHLASPAKHLTRTELL
jgi:Arm DNA-binding domain